MAVAHGVVVVVGVPTGEAYRHLAGHAVGGEGQLVVQGTLLLRRVAHVRRRRRKEGEGTFL